jgi:hypothetical protein
MTINSAASMLLAPSLPSAEKAGQKRPHSSRFVHIAKPLRSQYTIRTRSRRFEKKMNRWPLSGSWRSTSRTSTIRLSAPLRPSTGCVATNNRTLGGAPRAHTGRRCGGLNSLSFSHFQPQKPNLLVRDHRTPEAPATWPKLLGSRPSHTPSARPGLCKSNCRRPAGVIVADQLRGDTDFSMTAHLDHWDEAGVRFVFGHEANPPFVDRAEDVHSGEFTELCRKAGELFASKRARPTPFKEQIVRERGYLNKRLVAEDTAEFEHKPYRAKRSYRIVVLRKLIEEERGQLSVGTNFRYSLLDNASNIKPTNFACCAWNSERSCSASS